MKYNFLRSIMLLMTVSLLAASCIKDDVEPLGDAGSTFIKIPEARENAIYFSVFSDVKPVDLFSIRKDANSSSELNTATTVKLTKVDDLITAYNDENGTTFEPIPDSLFTTTIPNSGGVYDMSLASGEFAKSFTIQLNGSKWDIAHTYAMAVVLSDIGGKTATHGLDTVIAFLSVKNKYDGVYDLNVTTTGWSAYSISDGVPGDYGEIALATSGPNSAGIENYVTGTNLQPAIDATGAITQFGAASPVFTFDPATDNLISVVNSIPDDGRGRAFEINSAAPASDNVFDPATGSVTLNYFLKQTGRPNMNIIMKLTYVGSR